MSRKRTVRFPTPTTSDAMDMKETAESRKKKGKQVELRHLARSGFPDMTPNDAPTVSLQLTLSAEDSPASQSAQQGSGKAKMTSGGSGQSSTESFASLGPDGSWLRTCQGYSQLTLEGCSQEYSETWPRAGTMRNGTVYQQPQLAPHTSVTGSSSWPTPTTFDNVNRDLEHQKATRETMGLAEAAIIYSEGKPETIKWKEMKRWPTPMSRDWKDSGDLATHQKPMRAKLAYEVGGQLNPTWVEWLMGFPSEWTDLDASGTP